MPLALKSLEHFVLVCGVFPVLFYCYFFKLSRNATGHHCQPDWVGVLKIPVLIGELCCCFLSMMFCIVLLKNILYHFYTWSKHVWYKWRLPDAWWVLVYQVKKYLVTPFFKRIRCMYAQCVSAAQRIKYNIHYLRYYNLFIVLQ